MTDADHIAFSLLAAVGIDKPTQEQVTAAALHYLNHVRAQRLAMKFMETKISNLEKENFALAAHQCSKGQALPNGDFICCCNRRAVLQSEGK